MYSSSSGRGSLAFFVVELEDMVAAVVLEEEEAVAGTGGGGGSVPVAEVEDEEAEAEAADDVEPLDVAALPPVRLSEEAW